MRDESALWSLLWRNARDNRPVMLILRAISLSRHDLPAFAAQGIYWGAFAAYVPQIKAHIGASDGAFGLAMLVTAAGAVTAMLSAPVFAARFGRYAVSLASVLLALAFQAPMWVASVPVFAALMFFAGAGSGLQDVVMNTRLSRTESRLGASLMNLNHAMFSFAYAASAISAGLAREAGLPPAPVFATLGLLTLIASAFMMSGDGAETHGTAKAARGRFGGVVLWGGLIVLVAFLAENATEGWSALHVERTLGGGAAEGALGPAMLGLTMGIGRFTGQLVVGRLSETRVVFWSALVTACGALLAAIAPVPLVAYAGFAILGLGVSTIAPMLLALAGRLASDDARAYVISRVTTIGYFGFFIGPPIMGFIAQGFGLRMSFGFVALLLLLIPGFLALMRRAG
ncbi:MFS transporter [Nioella sediminis]|uniref:MFS transporter n=1 Tax=Nioella sediminis TaxID=1912092 RepID=UPI001D0C8DB1|nr:MFS transporter [Nioella sediminis]